MTVPDDNSLPEVLDVMGMAIPYPLYLTKKRMVQLEYGRTLTVLCDSPESAEESIPHYAAKMGYTIEKTKLPDRWEISLTKT
jgi:TusA-related sulfurtransferase